VQEHGHRRYDHGDIGLVEAVLLAALPSGLPPPASASLRRAAGLVSRMTGYLEKSRPPAGE
jgi:hypothetical protein